MTKPRTRKPVAREPEFRIHRKGFCPDTLRRVARELRKQANDWPLNRKDLNWEASIAAVVASENLELAAKRYAREARQAVKPRANGRP